MDDDHRGDVLLSRPQFEALMAGHKEIRDAQISTAADLAQHIVGERAWQAGVAADVAATKLTQAQMADELKRNTEATEVVVSMLEAGRAVVKVSGWIVWIVKALAALLVGTVSVLVAVKALFVSGDQSVIEWIRSWGQK